MNTILGPQYHADTVNPQTTQREYDPAEEPEITPPKEPDDEEPEEDDEEHAPPHKEEPDFDEDGDIPAESPVP